MIGWLSLIPELFHDVLVPESVWIEVVEQGVGLPGSAELASATWAKVIEEPARDQMLALLLVDLDPGEAAAVALAAARRAERLLVDDRAARRVAAQLGIPVIGTLGILVAARRRGLVEQLAPLLSKLRVGGFWMSAELEAAVLDEVGETPDSSS
jgi:uncharacterized protein